MYWETIAGCLFMILLILSFFKPARSTHRHSGYRPDRFKDDITIYRDVDYSPLPIMSEPEKSFWILLRKALPGYFIFPQVSTNALVGARSNNPRHFWNVINRFNTTRIDFVICNKQMIVVCLVELDDKSHDGKEDKDMLRDFITKNAGYKTLRFDCRSWPSAEQIRKKMQIDDEYTSGNCSSLS
jgi:hypothetical protein